MQAGDRLGPYEILEEIGEGGMARVYRVRKGRSGEVLVAKVLKPDLAVRESMHRRFLREAKILTGLDHPHVVRVLEVGPPEPPAWFVMEWVPGPGLDVELEDEKPLEDARAVAIMRQVLAALEHAHARGVVHRDLKPENVLMTADGQVKLSDFGIAKLLEGTQLTATGAQLGTPRYMAPEQVRGRRSVGPGVDVYAAGVLFYEMLTGKTPFSGEDPVSIGYAHAFEEVPPLKRRGKPVPEELAEICLKALEKKPQARFRTARTMRRSLEKAARKLDLPLPKVRSGAPASARRSASPSRPDTGIPEVSPGARHAPPAGARVTRSLVRLLVALVLLSVSLTLLPGARPGVGARTSPEARRARADFLRGLTASETGRPGVAVTHWRRAGDLDPSILPWIRDHAAQAFDQALARGDLPGARAYLRILRWADPGWERGLERLRRFRERWPPLDA